MVRPWKSHFDSQEEVLPPLLAMGRLPPAVIPAPGQPAALENCLATMSSRPRELDGKTFRES